MNVEEELKKRFAEAARAYAEIPVLIGPKWLRPGPAGGKDLYQYFGAPKVAKALKDTFLTTLTRLEDAWDLANLIAGRDSTVLFIDKARRLIVE